MIELLRVAALFSASTIATLGLLEAALWFMPVTDPTHTSDVTSERSTVHFKSNRKVMYSKGWNFKYATENRINNVGFVNDKDYAKSDTKVIAIIGDSYVEALMVRHVDTLQGRLQKIFAQKNNVYRFGVSSSA